jgi:WD40 repeat protein
MLAIMQTIEGGDIRLFTSKDGRYPSSPTYVIPNNRAVESLSFGPDGSLAVGTDAAVSVYSAADGYSLPPVRAGPANAAALSNAQFGADGLLTITDSTATLVDRYSAGALTSVPMYPKVAASVAALSVRNVLAVAETDGLHLYVAGQGASRAFIDILTVPYPGRQAPDDVGFSPAGRELIENIGGEVYIYDTRLLVGTLQTLAPDGEGTQGPDMEFDPADTAILAAVAPGGIDLINVTNGKASVLPGTAGATWVSFSPAGALAIADGDGVRLFPDPLTERKRSRLIVGASAASRVAFSPAGALAVVWSGQPLLTVYPPGHLSSGIVVTLRVPGVSGAKLSVENAVFGPRGQLAAVLGTGVDQRPAVIAVFAAGTYAEQGFIADVSLNLAHDDRLIAFAPDGTLAVGTAGGIELYGPGAFHGPRLIAGVLSPDDSGYSWLMFSRGGILLSADSSTGVSLWDYVTGQNLATFSVGVAEPKFGMQLAISPDGKDVAYANATDSGGPDDTNEVTLVWSAPYLDGDVADGVRSLCDELGAAPGPSQWRQYFTSGLPYPGICG